MHTASYEFLMKPKESAGCHQTLSARVGSGDETSGQWPTCMIASRDYCHAPLGVSSFSFSIQNVWEMTTVVDKIACRSCTACPPPIVLRLFIADTIGFTKVYS